LSEVFKSVLQYLDDVWEKNFNNNIIGNYGQAVVLLVPRLKLADNETKVAFIMLNQIKAKHPGKAIINCFNIHYEKKK
jgi:hypothetical protein